MTLPSAPIEGGGSKISFYIYDNSSVNAAAIPQAIKVATVNAETVGWLGVASHTDAEGDGGSEPVILVAGSDGTNVLAMLTDTGGRPVVVGSAAHGSAATSNPLQAGGVYRNALPALDDGDAGSFLLDAGARLRVSGPVQDNVALGAGGVFPLAALLIEPGTAIPGVDDEAMGVVRMSMQRALMTACDQAENPLHSTLAVTDTSNHDQDFDLWGRGYRDVSVYITNTHDQPANVTLMAGIDGSPGSTLYSELGIVAGTSGVCMLGSEAPAAGAANYKYVPALRIPIGTLRVRISFAIAPSSGAVSSTLILRS